MQHSHGGSGYEVGCDWISGILNRKPVRNYGANHTGRAASSVRVDVLLVLVPVKKFSPTSCYWSVVKWVLLSQQIRLKALAVMEQTCSQPLHSGALFQSKCLLGPCRHFRHHCAPPIYTCRQTCRCPKRIHKWHMHIFSREAVQTYGCRLFQFYETLSIVRTSRWPAGHQTVKHVKCPAESKRHVELPIHASTSHITAPGDWQGGGQHTAPACVIANNFERKSTLTFSIPPLFSLPSPPYGLQPFSPLLVYYISPTQRKWTLFPSTSRTWAALRHSDVQTERPARPWGT